MMPAIGLAIEALKSMVVDSGNQVMTLMQVLGHSDTPWPINSEIGNLRGVLLPNQPLFTFQRYDVLLEREWLQQELGINLSERQVEDASMMDNVAGIPILYDIGHAAAEKFITPEQLMLKS